MAIEIAPQREIKKNLLLFIILGLSIVVFLALAGSYFYFGMLSNKTSLKIKNIEQALEKTPEEKALEEELILYQSKINDFDWLLKNHKKTSNIFFSLEELSHPNVWFSQFSFNQNTVIVSGQAKNFQDIGQQLGILKESNTFEKVDLTTISLDERGEVVFSLQLLFKPEIFD